MFFNVSVEGGGGIFQTPWKPASLQYEILDSPLEGSGFAIKQYTVNNVFAIMSD